jgi:uncharacterized protein YyaL (SSP411 family)
MVMGGFRLLAAAFVVAGVAAQAAQGANPPPLPSTKHLLKDQHTFLTIAEQDVKQTRELFANDDAGFYNARLVNNDPNQPLPAIWYAFPLFEATNAVAIADPSAKNIAAVNRFAQLGENYWDPTIENGAGGFSWYYSLKNTGNAYFDDNGWWGIAYLDAYRATGNKRWLWDAGRALGFIDQFGWDWAGGGGVWWDVAHDYKTSEPLAAGALIAATLYEIQKKPYFLEIAKRYIAWANENTRNKKQGNLYGRNATDKTIMDYVEGMMISAHAQLCVATKDKSWCKKAETLASASLNHFPIDADWAPETDVIYLRCLLDLYNVDHNPRWYAVAHRNGLLARKNARDPKTGLWSLRWDGGYTLPGTLYTQSATLELFAWLAGAAPPGTTSTS